MPFRFSDGGLRSAWRFFPLGVSLRDCFAVSLGEMMKQISYPKYVKEKKYSPVCSISWLAMWRVKGL